MKPVIYQIVTKDGTPIYVGATISPKTRIVAHRKRFGKGVKLEILQSEFQVGETFADAEQRWIGKLREQGIVLANNPQLKHVYRRDELTKHLKPRRIELVMNDNEIAKLNQIAKTWGLGISATIRQLIKKARI